MATTRRATRDKRCPDCMVHADNCFCKKIQVLDLQTKVSLIIFRKERFLPSNTAHLTLKSLKNSQQFERGYQDSYLKPEFIDEENYHPLYLYPSEEATELTPDFLESFNKPVNLIVPDGTWRQAKKVYRREPLLSKVTQVKITPQQRSIYPLRRQKFEYGLCTHEAISYSLGILEGLSIQEQMLKNLKVMIEAHLKNRPIFEKEKRKGKTN